MNGDWSADILQGNTCGFSTTPIGDAAMVSGNEAEHQAHAVRSAAMARHPLGSRARVLLTSVFGPYARDDEYGSRAMNPMELYHNQVTREQGPFSLRMFHRSWGLMMMQANIAAPCALLDFPTLDRFIAELHQHRYDIVGISSIVSNELKVRKMCELIRKYQPQATIVVGGHIANVLGLEQRIDADYIVRGEGVRWLRRFLGEGEEAPLRHPLIVSGIGARCMGMQLHERPGDVAATLIPSVGCPLGCNFCSTSAMFGGKGRFVNFYSSGDQLFDLMQQLANVMNVRSFFVMDENFLLYRKRALRLLELMQLYGKAWSLYVFSSANVLRRYSIDELVGLGISWVWMGLEGKDSQYTKLRGIDTPALIRDLQSHGIRVLGSSIIGLEDHSPENIDEVIEYAVSHNTDFHQFMLYTPVPGTALHAELTAQGRMKERHEFHPGDIHGQSMFNYRHPLIPAGNEGELLARAFRRDAERNGPSVARIARTTLAGWRRYKHHPDPRLRDRYAWEARELGTTYAAVVAATRLYYRNARELSGRLSALMRELVSEFGVRGKAAAAFGGRYLRWNIEREQRRLDAGWTYEPPTFYEFNSTMAAIRPAAGATLLRYVSPTLGAAEACEVGCDA
jgi:hypothetical protein